MMAHSYRTDLAWLAEARHESIDVYGKTMASSADSILFETHIDHKPARKTSGDSVAATTEIVTRDILLFTIGICIVVITAVFKKMTR